jgi:uncharacterized membrane protein
MSTVETVTLGVHILAGFVALGAGLGAFLTQKGGLRHRRLGMSYVYAMAVVSGTALVLLPLDPTFARQFLALVAIFSFYFAFSGYRVLSRKRPDDDTARADWVAVALLGVSGVGLLVMGVLRYLSGSGFATVLLVFGAIGTIFAGNDVRELRSGLERGQWVAGHVTRMGAGYIATVTAFSSVNFLFLPEILRWLWPTLVGSPLLFYLARTYTERFAPTRA